MSGEEETSMTDKMQAAHEARKTEVADTDYKLYKVISKHPGSNTYELSKKMHWSRGKTYGSIKRLENIKWIKTEKSEQNGRSILKVMPIKWHEFLTPEEIKDFKETIL